MIKKLITQAEKIVADNTVKNRKYDGEVCAFTLVGENGYPFSSVITCAKNDGIDTLYFASNVDSKKVTMIAKCVKANICFVSKDYSVSLIGDIVIDKSSDMRKAIWYDGASGDFEEKFENSKFITDDKYCVLVFKTKAYDIFIDGERARK